MIKPEYGVQMLQNRIRALFVRRFVRDVDMKNAHPTLLLYLCKKNDVDCPFLEAYVNNRAKLLEKHNLTKRDVLVAINKDRQFKTTSSWFRNFQAEMVQTREWFHENQHQFEGIVFGGNKDNPKASTLNRILCKLENEVLQVALGRVGPENVHTLMFDGFHLAESAFNGDVVPMLNEATAKWGIKWAVKPFDTEAHIPADFVFDYDEWVETATDYATVKMRLERNNARILEPACFASRADENSPYVTCNREQFAHKVSNYVVVDDKCVKCIVPEWMKDATCRTYKTIDFVPEPDRCPESTFNLFTGFPRRHTDTKADTSILHEHLRDVIAAGDPQVYEYVLNWEAHLVQKPMTLPRVCLLLKSEQQCGKDSWIDKCERLVGSKHVHRTAKIDEMLGNFNPSLESKLVYQLNELEGKAGFANKEGLKDLVTASSYNINKKNQALMQHSNYLRIVIFSNNHTPIEIPYDDRRYMVTKVSSVWKGNTAKFDEFHKAINNTCVMDAYYTELKQRDISKYDPRDRPITQAYRLMQQACISDIYYVLRDAIGDERLAAHGEVADGKWFVTPSRLKDLYREWEYDQGISMGEYKRGLVLRKLRDIEGANLDAKWRFGGDESKRCYSFDLVHLEAFLAGVFPPSVAV